MNHDALTWLDGYIWLGLAVVVQTSLALLINFEHLRFVKVRFQHQFERDRSVRVALFIPCKGMDVDLEKNLQPLMQQAYDNYEVLFIVENQQDPACEIIERVRAQYPKRASQVVVAGQAIESSQKIHNLLVATQRISPETRYLAFADSDAQPRQDWLDQLVRMLKEPKIGAVTGYRWFVPTVPSWANYILYSVNSNVATLPNSKRNRRIIWGGSWAMRRELFERVVAPMWKQQVNDDLSATRVLSNLGFLIDFEPRCVVASPLNMTMPEVLEFIRRQYMAVRFILPFWWCFALFNSTLQLAGFWSGVFLTLYGGITAASWTWIPAAFTCLLWTMGWGRAWFRQATVKIYFPEKQPTLKLAQSFDMWLFPVASVCGFLGVAASMFGKGICWRGIRYRLGKYGKVESIEREGLPLNLVAGSNSSTEENGLVSVLPFPGTDKSTRTDPPSSGVKAPAYRKAGKSQRGIKSFFSWFV
ncbi:Hypothetical protein PBC10988_36030 [Planctomycetales bacterium 10988]|nr:Hypothetical protein PBC10988_36030 [Planctomycetales bacterium 10988]